jgi:hypothetical protein
MFADEVVKEPSHPPSHPAPSKHTSESFRTSKIHYLVCFLFLLASLFAGILYGFYGLVPNYAAKYDPPGFGGRKLVLQCILVSVNALAGEMVLSWNITGDTGCDIGNPTSGPTCSPVNVFFDKNVAFDTSSAGLLSNSVPTAPIFLWDPTLAQNPRANSASFKTSINIVAVNSLQFYPFDKYEAEVFLFAQDSTTNGTVGVNVNDTRGVAVGFAVEALPQPSGSTSASAGFGVLSQLIKIKRGTPVKAYCIIIVIAVWLISLIFLFATMLNFMFGYALRREFLVIPIATLFTVTQLRATMPGAPDFGTVIDFAGLLPCLALMSACATLSIGVLAFVEHEKQRRTILHNILRTKKKAEAREVKPSHAQISTSGTEDYISTARERRHQEISVADTSV